MAIFSRRTLQRLIDENDKFLLKRQIKKHVRELNRMDKDPSLAFEWEIVLLNAFSKIGKVTHEKNFGGRKNADLHFESLDDPNQNFVVDITTISDKGLDKKNPVDALHGQLMKIAADRGLRQSSFSLHVGAIYEHSTKGGTKVKLKLPGRARFPQIIFNDRFNKFLHEISQNPELPRNYFIKTEDVDVTIGYNPDQTSTGYSHIDYTQVFSLTENMIYEALDDKLTQLRDTNFKGPLGIFLCDGSCSFLNRRRLSKESSWIAEDVIRRFLEENKSINFVVIFTVQPKSPLSRFKPGKPRYQVFTYYYEGSSSGKISVAIPEALKKLEGIFPEPESDALNAINFLKGRNPNEGRLHWEGMKVHFGQNLIRVKISSRMLLELLAGKMEQKQLLERYRFFHGGMRGDPNPFELALGNGQLIHEVSIEKSDFEDDDWITFKLSGPDPAISPFVVPKLDTKSSKNDEDSQRHRGKTAARGTSIKL
jgi:hypothetical protein